jgi:hypothetical protein
MNNYIKTHKISLQFVAGLLIFLFFNALTALTLGIHYDEAYYWMYAQHPALGYFDHPPMVSWLIYAGELLFNNKLALRFITLLISTFSIVIIWLIVKPYGKNPLVFWSLVYSVLLIHPYSFITTPDAPLYFFTVLFFLTYRSFSQKPQIINAIGISLFAALMFYSKYHAVLVIGFTFLSNLKLLRNRYFWVSFLVLILALLPHLWWQFSNDFVSFRYHLIDSHKTAYHPMLSLEYLSTQLLLTGPIIGWLLMWFLFKDHSDNVFEKGIKFTGVGIYVFFFFTTFMGDFEAHWTLVATAPLIIIAYKNLMSSKKFHRLVVVSGSVSFGLLLLVRMVLLTPMAEKISAFGYFNNWDLDAKIINEATSGYPLIYQDNWNKVARYAWYTNNSKVGALNSGLHRVNQFDLLNTDEWFSGDTVYVATTDSTQFNKPILVKTPKAIWYLKKYESFNSYYDLTFDLIDYRINNGTFYFRAEIKNPYPYAVTVNDESAFFQIYQRGKKWTLLAASDVLELDIPANGSVFIESYIESFPSVPENAYLMLKIGELNPIPVRHRLK